MLRKIKKFYLYRKIVLSFLLLNMISTLFVSGALYLIFRDTSQKEQAAYSLENLSQLDSSAERIYESLSPAINYILASGYASSFMERKDLGRLEEFRLLENLKVLQTANAQFGFIGVANLNTDRYLGTRGVYTGLEDPIRQVRNKEEENGLFFFKRNVRKNENIEDSKTIPVLTFVYVPKGRYASGLIVIDVEESYFRELFQPQERIGHDAQVFVLGEDGEILIDAGNGSTSCRELLPDAKKLRMTETSFTARESVGGEKYMVGCLKSSVPGWYFVSVRAGQEILPAAKELLFFVTGIEALMIGVNLLVTFLLAQRIYSPLGSLYRKLEHKDAEEHINEIEAFDQAFETYEKRTSALEEYRSRSARFLSDSWLKAVARGEIIPQEQENPPEYCEFSFDAAYYRVLLISFADNDDFLERFSEKDQQIIEFALGNILQELIGSYCVNLPVMTETNCRMVVLKLKTPAVPSEVLLGIGELQNEFICHMSLVIEACYGKCVSHWGELRSSWLSAMEGQRKRLFLGSGVIIDAEYDYGRIRNPEYPYKAAKNLGESLFAGDSQGIRREIHHFVERLEKMDVDNIIGFAARLYHEMVQNYSPEDSSLRSQPADQIRRAMDGVGSMEELSQLLEKLADRIMEERKRKQEDGASNDAVSAARSYMEEHYMDSSLSVEMLADIAGLSPAYFGKLFFTTVHVSCNDYLMELRLRKAAELLAETQDTVSTISQAVGINSTNYFYIVFKKKYGCTPVQYRRQIKEEQENGK